MTQVLVRNKTVLDKQWPDLSAFGAEPVTIEGGGTGLLPIEVARDLSREEFELLEELPVDEVVDGIKLTTYTEVDEGPASVQLHRRSAGGVILPTGAAYEWSNAGDAVDVAAVDADKLLEAYPAEFSREPFTDEADADVDVDAAAQDGGEQAAADQVDVAAAAPKTGRRRTSSTEAQA